MAGSGPRIPWLRVLAYLVVALMAVQGCQADEHFPSPPPPLRPTIVGVVASITLDASGYHALLADRRTIDEPDNGVFRVIGSPNTRGYLSLASEADGGFSIGLEPIESGCWEGYESPSEPRIVGDMGDSVRFKSRLDLQKAPSFSAEVAPRDVDGHLRWTTVSAPHVPVSPMSFCVNERGQVMSAALYPVSSPH
jgi:hypothetical protein